MVDIKILKPFDGYSVGQIVRVPGNDGVPDSRFWRNRINDSKRDGCVEVVVVKKPEPKPKADPKPKNDAETEVTA